MIAVMFCKRLKVRILWFCRGLSQPIKESRIIYVTANLKHFPPKPAQYFGLSSDTILRLWLL
jgi:hypothetical protein